VNLQFADESSFERDRRVLAVNLLSPMLVGQHFGRLFRAAGRGDILFVGSVTAELYGPKMSSYIASKHGLQGFVKALRV
jgi:short-subunit dehydrogenase